MRSATENFIAKPIVAVAASLCFLLTGLADTVTFEDGSTLDGKVTEINENCVELAANGETLLLQRSEFKSFEFNSNTGDPKKPLVIPIVAEWEKVMEKKTGLSASDREAVCAVLDALTRAEELEEKHRVEKELVKLNERIDVLKFIENTFDDAGVSQQMQRLEAYLVLKPVSALPLARKGITTNFAPMRVHAIGAFVAISEATGKLDKDATGYFIRGMVDPDGAVRIAAGHALATMRAKEATPVLIGALGAADPRLKNVANTALCRIWTVDEATVPEKRSDYWINLWNEKRSSVANAVDLEGLAPLVSPDAPLLIAHH